LKKGGDNVVILTIDTIQEAIAKYEQIIETKNKKEMENLFASLDMDITEVFYWQRTKNLAMMANIIDQESAMLIYKALNEWKPKATMTTKALAERIVLTQVFKRIFEELKRK